MSSFDPGSNAAPTDPRPVHPFGGAFARAPDSDHASTRVRCFCWRLRCARERPADASPCACAHRTRLSTSTITTVVSTATRIPAIRNAEATPSLLRPGGDSAISRDGAPTDSPVRPSAPPAADVESNSDTADAPGSSLIPAIIGITHYTNRALEADPNRADRNARGPRLNSPPAALRGTPEHLMHYDAHQPVIDDLEARILTIRDSL